MSERATLQTAALLLLATAAAWAILLSAGDGMAMGMGAWLFAWTAMMTAMMLPSAAPLALLFARRSSAARAALLTAGYLGVWAAAGLGAYELDMRLPDPSHWAVAAVLVVAGAYQLTPLKTACLKRCRSPLDFLVAHWRPGTRGALRLGVEHGAYCLGCCWALMVVLVVVGSMGLAWVVAIAAVVAAEKLLPGGRALARIGGVGLVAAGIVVTF